MKPKWERQPCGCVKANLPSGKYAIRCTRHQGKPSKRRIVAHFDADGIVRREM